MSIAISIFCSGRGSNFESIATAIDEGRLDARITSVVTDRKDAPVIARARARGLVVHELPFPGPSQGSIENRRLAQDRRVLECLAEESPQFIVMAGYLRIVSPLLLEAFESSRGYHRIVNIHPSLLPAFPGMNAYSQAFEQGCQVAGATVHLVDSGLDSGPICVQEAFAISDLKNIEEVERRGLEIEHRLYPEALAWILPEKFEVERNRRVRPY